MNKIPLQCATLANVSLQTEFRCECSSLNRDFWNLHIELRVLMGVGNPWKPLNINVVSSRFEKSFKPLEIVNTLFHNKSLPDWIVCFLFKEIHSERAYLLLAFTQNIDWQSTTNRWHILKHKTLLCFPLICLFCSNCRKTKFWLFIGQKHLI